MRVEGIGTGATAVEVTDPAHPRRGWSSRRLAVQWWILAAAGVPAMIAAWVWCGLSFEEEMTEQCKSLAAGSTEEGFGAVLGIPPVVLAHALGLIILGVLGVRGRRRAWSGAVYALLGVAGASLIGIAAAELLWAGRLFTMGAAAAGCG